MRTLKVAWWINVNNFGDCLTPVVLKRLVDIESIWCEPDKSDFLGCGSYLEQVWPTYKGTILGTGRIQAGGMIDLSNANVLALRGKLTQESTISKCELLGDFGLLSKYLCPGGIMKAHKLGIIAHWNDKELEKTYPNEHLIDIKGSIDYVIQETASCEKVITSSLHGLVLADALGIPRMWVPSDANPGAGFKFKDYHSVLGGEIEPNVFYQADAKKITKICESLLEKLKQL